VFTDNLFRTDAVADSPQIDVAVEQQQRQCGGSRYGSDGQRESLHAAVHPCCRTQQQCGQLVNNELAGVRRIGQGTV
jgi:hypothetical protein